MLVVKNAEYRGGVRIVRARITLELPPEIRQEVHKMAKYSRGNKTHPRPRQMESREHSAAK